MPMHLPLPERDVPASRDLMSLAPKFLKALDAVLKQLPEAMIFETIRTPERQSFLYGFGRDYDDGRGIVTQAPTHLTSWHGFGLAADIIHRRYGWFGSRAWYTQLGEVAESHGLTWGGRWRHADLPHVQWGLCRDTPSSRARALYAEGGLAAVWQECGAT